MKTYRLSLVVFYMYFSVVVLVTVSGQPTTDDKDEIAQLREELAKVRGELAKAMARVDTFEGKLAETYSSK